MPLPELSEAELEGDGRRRWEAAGAGCGLEAARLVDFGEPLKKAPRDAGDVPAHAWGVAYRSS